MTSGWPPRMKVVPATTQMHAITPEKGLELQLPELKKTAANTDEFHEVIEFYTAYGKPRGSGDGPEERKKAYTLQFSAVFCKNSS